jgi:hypothetical protein
VKLIAFTLAFDAMPWIERHLPIFQATGLDWHWIVAHGPSQNGGSTAWCQKQKPGLSTDGTKEYLREIKGMSRVTVIEKKSWPSKDAMCNAALEIADKLIGEEEAVLLQIDSDEVWKSEQLCKIRSVFIADPCLSSIMFDCLYYVGERLITQGTDCFGSHSYEWLRAWRYRAGLRFESHEPPKLQGDGKRMSKAASRELIGTFEHYAYATEEQCAYKERFYNYAGLTGQWRALQQHDKFPVELNRFFAFLNPDEKAMVVRA